MVSFLLDSGLFVNVDGLFLLNLRISMIE